MYHNISGILFVMSVLLYSTMIFAKGGGTEKIKTNVKESAEATKEYATEKKEEFEAYMKKELEELDAKITELKDKTAKQSSTTSKAVKEKTQEEIKNLEKQKQALHAILEELSKSSEEASL